MSFNHLEIEKKWQQYWEKNKTFKTVDNRDKPKFYVLDMFPYPVDRDSMLVTQKATPQPILLLAINE